VIAMPPPYPTQSITGGEHTARRRLIEFLRICF
jgi:hypothetical protein